MHIVIGAGSDIASYCCNRWGDVQKYSHDEDVEWGPWDFLMLASGVLNPGKFSEMNFIDWALGVSQNMVIPLMRLREALPHAAKDASVCFFSGPNVERPSPGYTSYAVGKAGLIEAVRSIDAEVEQKVFIVAPGFVKTKIHLQQPKGWYRTDPGTRMEDIFACIEWARKQKKEEVGGKHISVRKWLESRRPRSQVAI